MEKDITKFINPKSNDKLQTFSNEDLIELIKYLYTYNPSYRDNLNLPKEATFGTELEFVTSHPELIQNFLNNNSLNSWTLTPEKAIENGFEVVSGILKDEKTTWIELKKICTFLQENTKCTEECGSHIHIGAHLLGNDNQSLLNLMLLWAVYENIIFKFGYNQNMGPRPEITNYAARCKNVFMRRFKEFSNTSSSINEILDGLQENKMVALNLRNMSTNNTLKKGNTIELRNANGTLDEITWQNLINFGIKFTHLATTGNFDINKVLERDSINKDKIYSFADYNQLFIDEALELVDLAFDNNLDKINFLKQYLKLYNTGNEIGHYNYEKASKKIYERRK